MSEEKNKIKETYILNLPGAGVSAGPPLGPVIGQFGINTTKFVQDFNEKTKLFSEFNPKLKVYLNIHHDKNYTIGIDKPPLPYIFAICSNFSADYENSGIRYIKFSDFLKIVKFKFTIKNEKDFF